jgi:hypothetical protein
MPSPTLTAGLTRSTSQSRRPPSVAGPTPPCRPSKDSVGPARGSWMSETGKPAL